MTTPLHPDPVEQHIRTQERKSRALSLGISLCLIALILAGLAWIGVTIIATPNPPIVAKSLPESEPSPPKPQTWTDTFARSRPAPPSAAPANAIAAVRTSPISVSSMPSVETSGIGEQFGLGAHIGIRGTGPGGIRPIGPRFKHRCDSADRAQRLAKAKGKPGMDKAVLKALRWLKEQQAEDGSWGKKFPVSMTAFALLCYSGHCETVDSPEFGETVKKAIEYLVTEGEKGKGMMASTRDRNLSYEHAIAVYSLAEAYSMNKNARKPFKHIPPILKKAVPIIIEGQTNGGGWLYSYGSNGIGDLSVAGWNIQALKAAEYTGIKFSGLTTAKKKALKYLATAEDPKGTDGFFKYRCRDSDKGRLSLTGVGLLCSRMLGKPSKLEDKGLELILDNQPTKWDRPNLYAWYYHSQAAFQTGTNSKYWSEYSKSYQDVVYEAQEKDGSWPTPGGHANSVGPDIEIYGTCLATLMMEVYYRYLPTIDRG